MSIQPKWLAKILNGEKTIEIRKTMPKCDLPIDVYLYCTKDDKLQWVNGCLPIEWGQGERNERLLDKTMNGKVVAKFTLNKIEEFDSALGNPRIYIKANIGDTEVARYGNGKILYAWHIDNLVIFDKPKELSDFLQFYGGEESFYELKKAPQSWQYVYVEGDKYEV